jgi:microcystin degradation protein MlrC
MVVPIHTTREPGRSLVERIQLLEGHNGILSISFVQGFATGDVPDMGTKVLVYADGDAMAAQQLADALARDLIALRDVLLVRYLDIDTALDRAMAAPRGPVVLADRSDNPGSGAAGDSTFILRRMLERGIRDAALGPLWDPVAVSIAFDAGVCARIDMRIGCKIGPLSGDPVDGRCLVKALMRDLKMTGNGGTPTHMGDSALIDMDGIEIVLNTSRGQAMNVDLFTQLQCDLPGKRIVVVKSAQHFHASFSTIAQDILYVGAPGCASPDWNALIYRKIRYTKWSIQPRESTLVK